MHVLDPLAKLLLMPHESIPELMFPHGPVSLAKAIEPSR
jgi:hypothetical protein